MYLLDTNVISETRRPVRMHRNVKAWLEQTSPESLYTSVIVMMELERGVLGMERNPPAKVNLHGVNSKSAPPSSARSLKKNRIYIYKKNTDDTDDTDDNA